RGGLGPARQGRDLLRAARRLDALRPRRGPPPRVPLPGRPARRRGGAPRARTLATTRDRDPSPVDAILTTTSPSTRDAAHAAMVSARRHHPDATAVVVSTDGEGLTGVAGDIIALRDIETPR